MDINNILFYGLPGVVIIAGLTEAAKRAGLPSKFAPFAAIVVGIALAFTVYAFPQAIVIGVVLGLVASGTYDNITTVFNINKPEVTDE